MTVEDLSRNNPGWKNWKWQVKHSLRSVEDIREFYPNLPESEIKSLKKVEGNFRISLTPYLLSNIKTDEQGNPKKDDPLYKQCFPNSKVLDVSRNDEYARKDSNWELKSDFPTPILQHKYPNKVLFRMSNKCFGYCNICFEVARVSDKKSSKFAPSNLAWEKSLEYIAEHPEVEEVILSGGEPLLVSNRSLERRLKSIKEIDSVKAVRIHTRTLTYNPFRVDEEFVDLCKKYDVTGLGIHIAHPNEITPEFKEALDRFDERKYGSILKMAQIPLIKGVNDDPVVLHDLFMNLYADCKVKPYYLLHDMPWTPNAQSHRTSVRKGVDLMNTMKRRIPNVAMPEYIIVHHAGKRIVPLEPNGTPEFRYSIDAGGNPIIDFKNWKGNWETYLDGRD